MYPGQEISEKSILLKGLNASRLCRGMKWPESENFEQRGTRKRLCQNPDADIFERMIDFCLKQNTETVEQLVWHWLLKEEVGFESEKIRDRCTAILDKV